MNDELLSIDQVAFAPPFPNPAPTDEIGELAFIDIRDLFIDPRYQRPVGPKGERNIKQVIENFSWNLFSPLVVARREGGRYAVIDGQHRAIAARTHGGIEKVPCLIIRGGPSDEAKAFSVINGAVTAISPVQIWHARIVAGDISAIMLQRVFDAVGVKVLRSPRPNADMLKGETISIDAFEKAFKRHGRQPFELALRTVVDTKNGNPGYLRGPLIRASTDVFAANPEWIARPHDVLKAIRTVGIEYLHDKAQARKDATFFGAYVDELTRLLKKEMKR